MRLTLLWVFTILSIANCSKILFLVPFPGPSHWILLQNFAKELVNRGHEVTAIVNKPITNFQSANYTEILIDKEFNFDAIFSQNDAYEGDDMDDFQKIRFYDLMATPTSEHALKNSNVQKIIYSKNLHFDLVILEDFFQESWLMFAYKFDAPVITICTYGYSDFFDRAMGHLTPYSHIAHNLLSYGDDMTYSERVYNLILSMYDWWYRSWITLPKQNEIAHRYFSHLIEEKGKPLPTVEALYRNVSMIFTNTHKSTSKPRPQMPGIINVGGAHIKPPKPLPNHLKEFLDNSKHGVIFFSLGSFLQASAMPKEKLQVFLEVFGKLKQDVLWKFEDESIKNLPSNVKIQKWLPQSDILAHPNVILFIGHGGMSGTFEGVARGVPMLFIPFFADQFRNAQKCVDSGHALLLPYKKLSKNTLYLQLDKLVNDKSYYNRAKELSRSFNDYLVHPMDEAIFWIEYVIRSAGAKHLKSYAVNMSWISYLMLDIIFVPFAAIFITYLLLQRLFKRK